MKWLSHACGNQPQWKLRERKWKRNEKSSYQSNTTHDSVARERSSLKVSSQCEAREEMKKYLKYLFLPSEKSPMKKPLLKWEKKLGKWCVRNDYQCEMLILRKPEEKERKPMKWLMKKVEEKYQRKYYYIKLHSREAHHSWLKKAENMLHSERNMIQRENEMQPLNTPIWPQLFMESNEADWAVGKGENACYITESGYSSGQKYPSTIVLWSWR